MEEEYLDKDTCSESVLAEFSSTSLIDEKAVSLENTYILKICKSKTNKLGIAASDSSCDVYNYSSTGLKKLSKIFDDKINITDVKFSPLNDNVLYTSSTDGTIRLWDIRTENKCTITYEENPETKQFTKPLIAFDVSCNDRVLCAATEAVLGEAFMMFWDVRKSDLLGAYWNSHTDDIVQVQFSENKIDELISASVDGLINIFNISELNEEDALQYSLNAECAVDRLCRISDKTIACITDNIDVQLWNIETADQISSFSREDITIAMKRELVDDCYVIDVYNSTSDDCTILAGSYSDRGKCMRTLKINKTKLKPQSNFDGNKQIVRCSTYDHENDLLITGGESGIVSLWNMDKTSDSSLSQANKNKMNVGLEKLKIRKEKPY